MHVASEGSATLAGNFAYLTVQRDMKVITVTKCSTNDVQILFTKNIGDDVVLPPVCVSNGVIVVSVDGVMTKYGFDGKEIFTSKILKEEEVSKLNGRWDGGIVYLTGMTYEGAVRKPRYRMLWVDVKGNKPVFIGARDIGEPKKAFRMDNDLVVCGSTNTERIAAPSPVSP